MANDFEVRMPVAAPPDAVWALAGDPARIAEWFGPVAECEVQGDLRRATMRNGHVLVERLEDPDQAGRSYAYSVVSGIPGLTSHRATIRVLAAGDGSEVVWRQTAASEVEGYDAEARLAGAMRDGLERLRDRVEGGSVRT